MGIYQLIQKRPQWKAFILGSLSAWLLVLGIISFQQAKVWKNSEIFWGDVIENYPNHYYAYLSRAKYYTNQQQNEAAIADIEQSLNLSPVGEAWYIRGILWERSNNIPQAKAAYQKAIELGGLNVHKAYVNRGTLWGKEQNFEAALADFEAAIEAKDDYALAWVNRALILKMQGKLDNALAAYNQAIKLEPWNAVYQTRAVLLYQMKDFEATLSDLDQAIELNPTDGKSWFFRAELHKAMGESAKARSDAEQAKQLGFEVPQAFMEGL